MRIITFLHSAQYDDNWKQVLSYSALYDIQPTDDCFRVVCIEASVNEIILCKNRQKYFLCSAKWNAAELLMTFMKWNLTQMPDDSATKLEEIFRMFDNIGLNFSPRQYYRLTCYTA